jgi:hypothetical protein
LGFCVERENLRLDVKGETQVLLGSISVRVPKPRTGAELLVVVKKRVMTVERRGRAVQFEGSINRSIGRNTPLKQNRMRFPRKPYGKPINK